MSSNSPPKAQRTMLQRLSIGNERVHMTSAKIPRHLTGITGRKLKHCGSLKEAKTNAQKVNRLGRFSRMQAIHASSNANTSPWIPGFLRRDGTSQSASLLMLGSELKAKLKQANCLLAS